MSKIQRAIQELQKGVKGDRSPGKLPKTIGTLEESAIEVGHEDQLPPGEDTLELAALGSETSRARVHVDHDALRAAGFLAPDEEDRALNDQYRHIKRPLIAHAFGVRATKVEDGHIMLVSSALPGDGKTFTCINLAMSIARERDVSVLLIDGDVVKNHISKLFGVDGHAGLLDLLENNSQINAQDTIFATDVDGLSILASGEMRAHSTELLASGRMTSLLNALTLQDPNRIILIDSPPMLSTSEARVIASLVGQVVLVVCAGVTPQDAVLEAIDLIDESKAVNLVLNQARGASDGGYYSGYGGYGYGPSGKDDAG